MNRLSAIVLFLAVFVASACGQGKEFGVESFDCEYVTTPADSALATELVATLQSELKGRDITTAELMIHAGQTLLGNEYVAGTLDGADQEKLTLYLLKTDCILFVETCFNLARAAKGPEYPNNLFHSFASNVRQTRYRDGRIARYSDRVHYTTEWIRQGEKNGIVEDKSKAFGGVVYDHPIFFMSRNKQYYRQLKGAPEDTVAAKDLAAIEQVEAALNQEPQYYIPDVDIVKAEKFIQSGDIIGYMSATDGLDIAHVVLAYVTDKDGNVVYGQHGSDARVGFMHASMAAMKVIVDPKTISDYATSRKSITGIKVVRPL